ncbi:hypothetical protein [Trichloromonas sp.]|jgi:hypothetical protein|uniref:hypothetical protein n=1 Tax=Trichloromonas sp. TaxID=3069249 RepID=UPI002A4B50AF|nr:hypothetical protein [Trichloromonas sp.]
MSRLHKWNKEDAILTLYYVKYNLNSLPVKDEEELSTCIIGSTKASLNMQAANIRYILGDEHYTLSDYSKIQEEVVNEYNTLSELDLRQVVIDIISKRDVESNIQELRIRKKEKERKDKEKSKKLELDEIFRKMGKDPSKMRKVV